MEANHKKILKAISLELRHLLEGHYDSDGKWQPGDLEQRLAAIGVRRDRDPVPVDELAHLSDDDKNARTGVDAYLQLRNEAEVSREEAVAEFVRETAYTWANRLLCLRCMEARELIDEVILQKEAYGGRSLKHHRLAQREPEACSGEDDGLFAVLDKVFTDQTEHLPLLFDPQSPGVALRPSPAVLKQCLALLSGTEAVRSLDPATGEVFQAPDALGWAYQYWNTEEKNRVFETVRTKKGAKIAGADIIPATQLYTEPYMVKFLVQNSLGATWMGMHPESKLYEEWEYYVRDADRTPVEKKPMAEITFLDPACGSGHFLIEAFDLYYDMYKEEGELTEAEDICRSILEKNLFGIDIDARAVQIAEAALWMKAAERAFDFQGAATNLVAAVASHLKGDLWEEFLAGFEREPSVARVLRQFGQAMEHIDELGSLARPEEELRDIIHEEHATWERQVREQKEANFLFPEMIEDALSGHLPFQEISDDEFGDRLLYRTRAAINAFSIDALREGQFWSQLLGRETTTGFKLLDVLGGQYDVVAANPPYMGSGNMGPFLKSYVFRHFAVGKRDLYGAFLLRVFELTRQNGRVGLVTQQSWMFLKSYALLRSSGRSTANDVASGVLDVRRTELIAHLGVGAFADIGGAVVNCALFVFSKVPPTNSSAITAIRLVDVASPEAKARLLEGPDHGERLCRVRQLALLSIPSAPVIYWADDSLLEKLASGPFLSDVVDARPGIQTSDNARFLRFYWEIAGTGLTSRWYGFSRGGGYKKWHGLQFEVADWQYDGARMKRFNERTGDHWSRNLRNVDYLFKSGLVYSQMGGGSVGCRVLDPFPVFDVRSIAVFPRESASRESVLALLNSRYVSYAGRLLTQSLDLPAGYLGRIPLISIESDAISGLVQFALAEKEKVVQTDLQEYRFCPSMLSTRTSIKSHIIEAILHESLLATAEGIIESRVLASPDLRRETVGRIVAETGAPAAWLPLIDSCTEIPVADGSETEPTGSVLQLDLGSTTPSMPTSQSMELQTRLRLLFENGPGMTQPRNHSADIGSSGDSSEDADGQSSAPIPSETFLEELSQSLAVHPVSVYWLLKEGIEKSGWRCLPEERRITTDRLTVVILRLLGHRWPSQIEAGTPVPEWADPDGIIPLTEGTDESALLERLRDRIAAEFEGGDVASIEREFAEIMGKPLDKWLTMEFFKHHTRQFKKRPIGWQIQSSKFTARKKPAFACLVYYHKLDGDLLPKTRNQYVGPLRNRLETELRSIESVSSDARSDRQEGRRGELQDQIDELRDFDATLQKVITEGFTSKELTKIVKDEPLDKWCSLDGTRPEPESQETLLQQESRYFPDINDGVRVNIAPLQKAGLLAADVLAKKDLDKAIADRSQWRADERRWCRENKLPQPGWWPEKRRDTTNT